jgi:hypothetical protein
MLRVEPFQRSRDVGVDRRRRDVRMAEQQLHPAGLRPWGKQVRGSVQRSVCGESFDAGMSATSAGADPRQRPGASAAHGAPVGNTASVRAPPAGGAHAAEAALGQSIALFPNGTSRSFPSLTGRAPPI